MFLLWTSCYCRLGWFTWISVARGQCVAGEFLSSSEWHLPTLGAQYQHLLTSLTYLLGEVTHHSYSSMNRCVERCTEKISPHPWNVFACYLQTAWPLSWKAGGQGWRPLEQPEPVLLQLCAVPLWVQDLFPKGSYCHWNVKHGLSVLSVRTEPSFQEYF